MPELLKNMYTPSFFETLTKAVQQVVPRFQVQSFLNQIIDTQWEQKELKQRVRCIATALHHHLPGGYPQKVEYILCIINQLKKNGVKENGIEYLFFPDVIEQYGLEDVSLSLKAIEQITQFTTCEFAIRPFLLQYSEPVMSQMLEWSKHSSHLVRRFASEGCRPRLPWAIALPQFKKDPSPILPILENLKEDPSLFVRKSVANNLNDISKDHPDVVAQLSKKWKGLSAETDWIIRHGCRTMLKKADRSAYELFGLDEATACVVEKLELSSNRLKLGNRLGFAFQLKPTGKEACRLRIEYAIYYMKANGKPSRKLFKVTENTFAPGQVYTFARQQRFQDFTTRKHYPGIHKIGIVVNGRELVEQDFMLEQ